MSINYLYILIIILSFIQFNSKPSNNKITRKKLLFPKNSLKFLGNKEILISKENNKDIRFLDEEGDQQIDEDRDEVKDEEDKQKDELEKEELDKKENELKGDKKIDDDDDDDDENDVQDNLLILIKKIIYILKTFVYILISAWFFNYIKISKIF